jgi:queuine/archaeosine tRNA-ribosyltransferase
MTKFFTKNGWLTSYALSCGYIHKQMKYNGEYILQKLSSGSFEVAFYPIGNHYESICTHFNNVKDARKHLLQRCGSLNYRHEPNFKNDLKTINVVA